jgi:hypothetical protein
MLQNVIIFDWDDTLLPTSYIRISGNLEKEISPEISAEYNSISIAVKEILTIAKTYGEVIIITNSGDGWVKTSCEKFMPSLWPFLSTFTIISCLSRYSNGINLPEHWKRIAFEDVVLNYIDHHETNKFPKNIISLGDAAEERSALFNISNLKNFNKEECYLKSIKFNIDPTLYVFKQQIDFLFGYFDELVKKNQMMDIILSLEEYSVINKVNDTLTKIDENNEPKIENLSKKAKIN